MYDDSTAILYGLVALVPVVYLVRRLWPSPHDYPNIPAVGPSAPLLSYWGALQFLIRGNEMVHEGYKKYKGGAFKVPELFRWHVVVTGRKLIEDLRRAGSDELSFNEASADFIAVDFTLGPAIHQNTYHVGVIKNQLTRSIALLLPEIKDEVQAAFSDLIPPTDDWVKVPALNTIMKIISRTSNRTFVGLPKCRDPDYMALNIEFTVGVMKGAFVINMFPEFLRPLAARLLTNVPANISRGVKHLGPIIHERMRLEELYGKDYDGKPNDLLSWFMDEAKGEERSIRALVLRILTINFASIHTTSMSFTHALYHLAANPEYMEPLRAEATKVIKQDGWTRTAMNKLRRLDSFLKESHRHHGIGSFTMTRKALKDFTFSDGTFIPKDGFVSAAESPTHFDPENYENPEVFNPWRFVEDDKSGDVEGKENGAASGEGNVKNLMVSTSTDYVTFGHGRFACPGRFFAASELKLMMAYLVLNYDVQMEEPGVIPPPVWYSVKVQPNPTAKVLFRRRRS
ncbi:cytochrome P450 [Panus rudis PR-1116 ss-1]|nr:cytochrome P450 [Panus rudis PR-1116 ss-1]